MSRDPSSRPPYLDWRLDRWKLALLFCLLLVLLLWALFGSDDGLAVRLGLHWL